MPERRVNGEQITDNEFDASPNWYARVIVGGMSIVGVAAVMKKMGGPTARALGMVLDDEMKEYASKQIAKWDSLPMGALNRPTDLVGTVPGPDGKDYRVNELANYASNQESFVAIHSTDTMVSQSKLSRVNTNLERISDAIKKANNGSSLDNALMSLQIGTKDFLNYRGATKLSNVREEYIITATKVDVLKQYLKNRGTGFANAPEFERLFEQDLLSNFNDSDLKSIKEVHDFYIKNDAEYLDLFDRRVASLNHDIHKIVSGKVSGANENFVELKNRQVFVPRTMGQVGQQLMQMTGPIKMEDKSIRLFSGGPEKTFNDQQVSEILNKNLSNDIFTETAKRKAVMSRYKNDLHNLGRILNDLAVGNPEKIEAAYINYNRYETSSTPADYFEIVIRRKGVGSKAGADFRIPIPVVNDNNMLPNISDIEGRKYHNIMYSVGNVNFVKKSNQIDTTQALLSKLQKMLSDARMNDVLRSDPDDIGIEIKKWMKTLSAFQRTGSHVEGEQRDIFKSNQNRVFFNDEFATMAPSSKANAAKMWASGAQSMLNLTRINTAKRKGVVQGKKTVLIGFDLETLNLHSSDSSPHFTAAERGTGIWQAGIQVLDTSSRQILDMKELVGDHVLNEHRLAQYIENGTLMQELAAGNPILLEFSKYAQDTLGVKGNNLEAKARALEEFYNTVKKKANYSNKMFGTRKFSTNSDVFAHHIVDQLEALANQYTDANTQVMFVGANISGFDFEVLNTLTGGRANKLKKQFDYIDVTDVQRNLTLGTVDVTGKNVTSLVQQWASTVDHRANPHTLNLSTNEGASEVIRFLEKNNVVRADSFAKNKQLGGQGLLSAMKHVTGGTIQAHTSATTDITPVLGLVMMMRDNLSDDAEVGARTMNNFIQNQGHGDYVKMMEDYLQLVGISTDDNVSVSAASMSLLHKKATQKLGVGHIFPFSSIDPLNRQLAQQGRTSFIRRHDKNAHHRFWTSHTTNAALEAEAIMYKEAGFDRNMFANKLNMRTLFTIGSAGRQGGFMGVAQEAMQELKFMSKEKSIGLDMLPKDSRLADDLIRIQGKIYDRVNAKAKARGIKNIHKPNSKLTAPLFREAIAEVMRDFDKHSVTIDPSKDSHQKMYLGPNDIDISSTAPGHLSGIKLGYDPAQKKTRLLYTFAFETQDQHMSAGALNIGNIKAMPSILMSTTEARTHYSSKYGLYAEYEALANVDFLDKKFTGLTKRLVFDKAVDIYNNKLANKHLYSEAELSNARNGMNKIVSHLNEVIPGGAEWVQGDGYGFVKFGINQSTNENAIGAGFSKLSFSTIMDNMAAMGKEATFDKKQLLRYYGYFGGGKGESYVRKGIDTVNKLMNAEMSGMPGTKSASTLKEMQSIKAASTDIQKYIHPLALIQEKLDADASYGFKNATDMLLRGDDKVVEHNLKKMKIPTFTQIAFDEEIGGEALAFFGGTGVTPYAVNTEKRMQINHMVPIQHDYLTLAAHAPGLTKRNYAAILGSTTKNIDAPSLDLANTMNGMIEAFKNNVISEQMVKNHGLELDQIKLLATNDITRKAIDETVRRMKPEEKQKVAQEIQRKILNKAHMIETEEAIEEINQISAQRQIDDFNKSISGIKDNQRYLHVSQVSAITKLADAKNGVAFLPFKETIDDMLDPTQKLTIDLRHIVNSAKRIDGKDIDVQSVANIFRMLNKESAAMQNVERGIKNFEIVEDTLSFNKRGQMVGNMKISLAGLVMPINRNIKNVANKMESDIGINDMLMATKEMGYIQEVSKAYLMHYENTMKGINPDARHLDADAAASYFRLLNKIFPQGKDTPAFRATRMSELPSVQGRFHSSDHLINRARRILGQIDGGTNIDKIPELDSFFRNKGKSFATKEQKMTFINKLRMLGKSDMNTVIVGASSVFHPDQRHTVLSENNIAQHLTFSEYERLITDKSVLKDLEKAKQGLSTIQGNAVRFPILPAGLQGLNTNEVLAMTDDVFEFLRADNEKVYMFQRAGDLIHADNDRDIAAVMTQLFYTKKDLNDDRIEARAGFKKALQSPDMKNFIEDYNNEEQIVRQWYDRNGTSMVEVSKVTPDGKITTVKKPLGDVFENKNSLINKTMSVFTDFKFARQSVLHQSAQLMERHMETTLLGAYSSSIIGMVTNSVRARTQDIMGLNKVAGRNIVDMSLIGGTMKTGLGKMYQMSVEAVKHGQDVVFQMTEAANFWKDPSRATASEFKQAKNMWMDAYDAKNVNGKWVTTNKNYSQDMINAHSGFMDVLYDNSKLMTSLRKESPEISTYMNNMTSLNTGAADASFYKLLNNTLTDELEVAKFNSQMTSDISDVLRLRVGKLSSMADGNFDFKAFYATLDQKIVNDLADPYARSATKRLNNIMSQQMVRKSGKFAGVAALAFLGANFFRPNQLSSSMNPLDGFAQLNPTGSDNNAFFANEDLPRGMSLDKVDASFSKDAFIYNLDMDQSREKQMKSNAINSFMDNSVFRTQTNTKYFRTQSTMSITDRRSYIGPFGSSEHNRRF